MNARLIGNAADILPSTDFSVPAMRCAGCMSKLESGLPLQPGIVAARANFTTKRVTVTHLPESRIPELVAAFGAIGFEAQPLGKEGPDLRSDDSRALIKAMAVAGFAMMNIMLLSVSIWSGATGLTRDLFHWLSAMIALPTVAYAGRPFFKSAWAAVKRGRTNMDVPISIGVVLAAGLSLFETVVHGPHAYFDGAVMLLFFLLMGRMLDSLMRDRARDGVAALLRNTPAGALVLKNDQSDWVATDAIRPGMAMLVASGERLAADGVVTDGTSWLDLSLLTGETAPQAAVPGSIVHAGTLNLDAPIQVRVTASGQATTIADIARLMEEAAQGKSRYVRIADRAARYYAPAVHTLAVISFAGWVIAGAGWHEALLIAVAVLIITCPCALGLAVPAAQVVAAGVLMRHGVLVKDGSALERLAEVDWAMFDKTGTLTLGQPEPINLMMASMRQKSILLALARNSRHPLSEAIRLVLEREHVQPADLTDIEEQPGAGIFARCSGQRVSVGRPTSETGSATLATQLSIEGEESFIVHFADMIRPDAGSAIKSLQGLGIGASILSGDRAAAVAPVARALRLTALTSLLPQDKLAAISRQSAAGHRILMVGDGLNDGPALAAGHASMAPASASDAGRNAADLVFMGDSLAPVSLAVRVARATQAIVRQNFALAIGYNMLAVPLAIMGFVTPLIAALAMSGSSLIVVANALRIKAVRT